MEAGRLRERVTLQQKSTGRDTYGGETVAWTDVCTVWAELEPWHLRDRLVQRRMQGESVIGLRVRSPLDVSLAKRVVFKSIGYDVIDIDATREHLGELLITARAEASAP